MSINEETLNLLYIEDDEQLFTLISHFLEKSKNTKFNVISKTTLESGIEYLKNNCSTELEDKVHAILLDLILPNSHGVGTFKRVKETCPDIPIVIISAYEDIACECVKKGAQDYLVKPEISPSILVRSIKYAIERANAENMYKDIIRTSPLGYNIFKLIDNEIILVDYNPSADDILNLDNSKLLYKTLQEAFPGVSDELKETYLKTLKEGIPFSMCIEYEDHRIPKGYFKIHGHRTASNDLVLSFENITEQVYMQEKILENEIRYKQLVEATGAGVYEIDFRNMKFSYVNDVVCKQSGYTKKELLEMSPFEFLTEEGSKKFLNRIEKLKRGEYIEDATEYEAIRKDGSSIWIMLTARFIEDDQKNVIGANVVAIDITHKVMAERMIKEKETEVFNQLENRIKSWKKEMIEKNIERDRALDLINQEIEFMSAKSSSEVF